MKTNVIIVALFVITISLTAQTDTAFYFENHKIEVQKQDGELKVQVINDQTDSAEIILFEGNYGEDFSSEVGFNFTFAKLEKKKTSNNPKKKLYPHSGGISWGFSSLASRNLNIANVENAQLKYSSYELGFNLGNFVVPMSKKHKFMFFMGIGFRFHRYNSDYNTAFRIEDNYVQQVSAPEDIFYKTSKLTAWYITVPAMIEWQKKDFYIQAGLEGGLRFFSASKVKHKENGKKTKEKIGNKMNMNPVTVDAKIGLGYGPIGVYARYGLVTLFRAGRGPTVVPVSIGIQWNISMKTRHVR